MMGADHLGEIQKHGVEHKDNLSEDNKLTTQYVMPFHVLLHIDLAPSCNQSIHAKHRSWLGSDIRLDFFGNHQKALCISQSLIG